MQVEGAGSRRQSSAAWWHTIGTTVLLSVLLGLGNAAAQGIASGTIRGRVTGPDGANLDGAAVRVINTATGFMTNAVVRHGRFVVQGLELSGSYTVEARRIGFRMQRQGPLTLALGDALELRFILDPTAVTLAPIDVAATRRTPRTGDGTATTIPEELVQRLPTLNRNFYDFVALAPQISTKVGFGRTGVSAAGANQRFNTFLINGADERYVAGNVSAASNNAKSVPIDAVKEYQILVAPYDVRFGDFAGALINTVTKSGGNDLTGTTFAAWRGSRLRRDGTAAKPYDRFQYGLSLGGPIVRNRLHFFVAPELQRVTEPAAGPYLGQPAGQVPSIPARQADLDRFAAVMRDRHGLSTGSAGAVRNASPLRNLFARIDGSLPSLNSRVFGFVTYSSIDEEQFSRAPRDSFAFSSLQVSSRGGLRLGSLQVHTDFPGWRGAHNELAVSHVLDWSEPDPAVRQPLVRVLAPGANGGTVVLSAGTPTSAQGRFGRSTSIKLKDEFSVPWAAGQLLTVGFQLERFRILRGGVTGGYGVWTFSNLDALEAGIAERYDLRKDFGTAMAPLRGGQYAGYLSNEWRPGDRLSITAGLRADRLAIDGQAPLNAQIDSIFGRRTDRMPRATVYLSPRVGFTWNPSAAKHDRLRGGVGVFTGRPPLAWLVPGLANYGEGIGVLSCGGLPTDAGLPPGFEPDYRQAPARCATGPTVAARPFGDVDLLASDLSMARTLRTSLGYERRFGSGFVATADVVVSRALADFRWVNLNLVGPQATDRFGRVLYGSIGPNAIASPAFRSRFAEVIDLQNTSANRSWQLSGRLERRASSGVGGVLSYTYSRTRDVQSPSRVNQTGLALWADAGAVSARHEEPTLGISLNDLPHRIVAAVTWKTAAGRWPTEFAFYYVGESGSPFTYTATGVGRRGDLNADGSNANDPIYVPRDATNPSEIAFLPYSRPAAGGGTETVTAATQAAAFEALVERTSCLRRQRGRIMERNSCREPWTHTMVTSVRTGAPLAGRIVEVELSAFNLLNLVNGGWGLYRVATPRLLDHVGQTTGTPQQFQPQFNFDPGRPEWETLGPESAFQLQIGVRYRF